MRIPEERPIPKLQLRSPEHPRLLSESGHGNSGAAADSPTPHPLPRKAGGSGRKAAADSAAPPENAPQMKRRNALGGRPVFPYELRADGKAPEMAQIHVSFAKLSAALLVETPALRMEDLKQKFNAVWQKNYLKKK